MSASTTVVHSADNNTRQADLAVSLFITFCLVLEADETTQIIW